ncbi:uncharacterized protein SPSK_10989 [Sporothrix schenckii 1099-18]|uniref:Uncharacterized protein n=1 Tax=Sporothrix schenckii 1099-18 TaxID=1397361 RepID=A0A0F2M3X4_SPOSC|nr:uncharacterized protein SPSK_10989 [Sporothrix schenckii 1099-18]KJR83470.1 hypothetical protein SPSK_10989 [Sporothrix schenckii 1099-18]
MLLWRRGLWRSCRNGLGLQDATGRGIHLARLCLTGPPKEAGTPCGSSPPIMGSGGAVVNCKKRGVQRAGGGARACQRVGPSHFTRCGVHEALKRPDQADSDTKRTLLPS